MNAEQAIDLIIGDDPIPDITRAQLITLVEKLVEYATKSYGTVDLNFIIRNFIPEVDDNPFGIKPQKIT